jgi:hypothetical protein
VLRPEGVASRSQRPRDPKTDERPGCAAALRGTIEVCRDLDKAEEVVHAFLHDDVSPVPLFTFRGRAWSDFAVSADGKRFLAVAPQAYAGEQPFTVIVNWTAEVRR